jgi:hypothetical protein
VAPEPVFWTNFTRGRRDHWLPLPLTQSVPLGLHASTCGGRLSSVQRKVRGRPNMPASIRPSRHFTPDHHTVRLRPRALSRLSFSTFASRNVGSRIATALGGTVWKCEFPPIRPPGFRFSERGKSLKSNMTRPDLCQHHSSANTGCAADAGPQRIRTKRKSAAAIIEHSIAIMTPRFHWIVPGNESVRHKPQ